MSGIESLTIEGIAEEMGIPESEVKSSAKNFLKITKNNLSPAEARNLRNILVVWKKTAAATKYMGVSRQRIFQLAEMHNITPRKFGEKTQYWKVADLDYIMANPGEPGRPPIKK